MTAKTTVLFFLAVVGIFLSCNQQTLEDVELQMGYEYFPLQLGQSRTYAVDSILFDPAAFGTAVDTLSGFFREELADTLRDESGALVYRIERYYRKTVQEPWRIHSVVSSSRDEQEAVYTENNLRFVKLRFPLKIDREWDGTAYFPKDTRLEVAGESIVFFKGWNTTVLERRPQLEVEGRIFSDVFLVELANFENKIEYRYGLEAYAPDIGLVYQEIQVMDTQCQTCCNGDIAACDGLPWIEKAEKGLILKKRLLSW